MYSSPRASAARFALGMGVAQIIAFTSLLMLTRLTPSQSFGYLGAFLAASAIVANVACLRFEVALALPKSKALAADLAVLALASAAVIAASAGLGATILLLLEMPIISKEPILATLLLPLFVLAFATFQVAIYLEVRDVRHDRAAWAIGLRAAAVAFAQLILVIVIGGDKALLLGHVIGFLLGAMVAIYLLGKIWRRRLLASAKAGRLRRTFRQYRGFPLASAPQAVMNSLGQAGPILYLSAVFPAAQFGFLVLAQRLTQPPVQLLASSISQALLPDTARRVHQNHPMEREVRRLLLRILGIGLALAVPAIFLAPWAVETLFGRSWLPAVPYVQWLILLGAFEVPATVASNILTALAQQKRLLLWEAAFLILRFAAVCLGSGEGDLAVAFACLLGVVAVYLLGVVVMAMMSARRHDRRAIPQS